MTISSAFSLLEVPQANFEPKIFAVFFKSNLIHRLNAVKTGGYLIRMKTSNVSNGLLFSSWNSADFNFLRLSLLFCLYSAAAAT